HDRQCDIGFEQRDADLAQRRADIVLAQRAAAAQPVEDLIEAIAEAVKHAWPTSRFSSTGARNAKRAGARNSRTGRLPDRARASQHPVGNAARTLRAGPDSVNRGAASISARRSLKSSPAGSTAMVVAGR